MQPKAAYRGGRPARCAARNDPATASLLVLVISGQASCRHLTSHSVDGEATRHCGRSIVAEVVAEPNSELAATNTHDLNFHAHGQVQAGMTRHAYPDFGPKSRKAAYKIYRQVCLQSK